MLLKVFGYGMLISTAEGSAAYNLPATEIHADEDTSGMLFRFAAQIASLFLDVSLLVFETFQKVIAMMQGKESGTLGDLNANETVAVVISTLTLLGALAMGIAAERNSCRTKEKLRIRPRKTTTDADADAAAELKKRSNPRCGKGAFHRRRWLRHARFLFGDDSDFDESELQNDADITNMDPAVLDVDSSSENGEITDQMTALETVEPTIAEQPIVEQAMIVELAEKSAIDEPPVIAEQPIIAEQPVIAEQENAEQEMGNMTARQRRKAKRRDDQALKAQALSKRTEPETSIEGVHETQDTLEPAEPVVSSAPVEPVAGAETAAASSPVTPQAVLSTVVTPVNTKVSPLVPVQGVASPAPALLDASSPVVAASPARAPNDMVVASPSPARLFTTECSMEELEAVLRKQESRMANQKKSTPAKVAAMHRERRWLEMYGKQAAVNSAVHSASMDMVSAMSSLRDSLGGTPRSKGSTSVVRSWLRWGRTAKDYGMELWKNKVETSREQNAAWRDIVEQQQNDVIKQHVQALCATLLAAKPPTSEDKRRVAQVQKDAVVLRMTKACELFTKSESGKMLLREATKHWDMNKMLCSMVAWMKSAQVRLVQQCLTYSAKSHWTMQEMQKLFTLWRSATINSGSTLRDNRNSMLKCEMKARRLSLQRDRCTEQLLRQRQERRLSLDPAMSRIKAELRTSSPLLLSNKGMSPALVPPLDLSRLSSVPMSPSPAVA